MSHRIKVLQLVPSSQGGGATHVRDLALGLDSAEFDVRVAMPEDGGSVTRTDFQQAGLIFHPISIEGQFSLSALRTLAALARQADILHVHGARAAYIGRLVKLMLGQQSPKLIYSVHGFTAPHYAPPKSTVLLNIERALAPLTDLMITVSHAEDRNVLKWGVYAPRRQVVWYGIDLERFQAPAKSRAEVRKMLGVGDDKILASIVCRLFYPRDFDALLPAIRRVVAQLPNFHLVIVGDGPWHGKIVAQIAELGLQDNVTLAGRQRDIPSVLAACDLYVLTSTGGDGMPISIMEAMASGLPVVASDSDGIPEEVLHGKTGLVVPKFDAEALAGALATVVSSAELRTLWGTEGKAYANKNFSCETMVEKIAACYLYMHAER